MLLFCSSAFTLIESPHNDEHDDDSDENLDEDQEELLASFSKKQVKGSTKKMGRKAQWSDNLIGDLVDIIASNDYFKEKLIFTNTKNQKNSVTYGRVLDQLKIRANARDEEVSFSVVQLRNKFKKLVGECKKAALTIKSASGIKRFQDEKSYGKWFDQLFALVKTRDSCQPEQAIEPSANAPSTSSADGSSPDTSSATGDEMFVPVKQPRKKPKSDNAVAEIMVTLKNFIENDPMKDFLQFAREEAAHARQHEIRMMEMFMTMQQQANSFSQQQPVYSMQPASAASGNSGGFFRNFTDREEQQNFDNQMYYQNL